MRGWQHLHKAGTQGAACAFSHANAALAPGRPRAGTELREVRILTALVPLQPLPSVAMP